jgi:cholesterol oxidase
MAFWPNKGDPDPRPPLGSTYRPVPPVVARRPSVPADAPVLQDLGESSAHA